MATSEQIAEVRLNTDEPDQHPFPDKVISDQIDATGVVGASASIWAKKAARYAALVDVSEAGASRKMSQLHDAALKQAAHWHRFTQIGKSGVTRIHKLVRT